MTNKSIELFFTHVDDYGVHVRTPCVRVVNDRFFSPYFSVYGRLRACVFDLGIAHLFYREFKRKNTLN